MELPLLGMGTWGMGGKFEKDFSNKEESIALIQHGLSLGVRLIDVAEIYGEGLTEEITGEALRGSPREEVFVISKVWKEHLRYDDVLKAAERSLKRLNTSYIDLYLIHWPNPTVPLGETMAALETLAQKGVVKHIGVSNFSVSLVEKANSYLKRARLYANQVEYNLSARDAEREVIPFCKKHDIKIIAYRPLAKGALVSGMNTMLESLSGKYRKTPAQVALNWIIGKGITAIPKAGSRAHLAENAGALGWSLAPEDASLLDASRF